jgi:hypothetical protein
MDRELPEITLVGSGTLGWRLLLFYTDPMEAWWSEERTYRDLVVFKRPMQIMRSSECMKLTLRSGRCLTLKRSE